MLEVTEGNKDEVANTQGRCAPTETVDAGWRELGSDGPCPGQSPVWLQSWAGQEAKCLFGAAGLNRRNFSKRKRKKRHSVPV